MQPDPATVQLVQAWLVKARHDLLSAELLSQNPEPRDIAAYHCQQGAEKALKGFLVWARVAFVRTHDLDELLRQCISTEPAFSALGPAAKVLSPYAVIFRYPDVVLDPTEAEVRDGIRLARTIYDFVERQIPPSAWP
jgi:HEPN domain-containing protein